ncbi:MAG: iron-containing alcohol dehydrogenase [Armatimonadia bacterium]
MDIFTIRSATEIVFGSGSRHKLGTQAASLGSSALLVTGRSAATRGNLVPETRDSLQAAGVHMELFAEVEPEPTLATVERGREAFRAAGCDLVIALGGGSAMDVGKAIGALANLTEPITHYFSGAEILGPGAPIIALPTTSGTGAEVTPNSVLTDPNTLHKASIRGRTLMPSVAIVDPELTIPLPPKQTAFSGLDALTQAIESYVSTGANPFSDPLAEESVRRLAPSLRHAVANGSNLPAREDLALGSLFAGLALASARLGLVHGLAHPLGALYHIPHGRVCGWLHPAVMRFNLEVARDRYAHLAELIGLPPSAEALIEWVETLACDLGACGSWQEVGLKEEDFDKLIPVAVSAGSSKFNPRPVTAEAVGELLRQLL